VHSISLVIACWERLELTKRVVESLTIQTEPKFRLFLIGDCCTIYQKMITEDHEFRKLATRITERGGDVVLGNSSQHAGHPGEIFDRVARHADTEWLMYAGNDDVLLPNHIENYLYWAERSNADACQFNLLKIFPMSVHYVDGRRENWHGNLIVRRSIAAQVNHRSGPAHDESFVENLRKLGTFAYCGEAPITYIAIDNGIPNSCNW
jgi:hypothetical protein